MQVEAISLVNPFHLFPRKITQIRQAGLWRYENLYVMWQLLWNTLQSCRWTRAELTSYSSWRAHPICILLPLLKLWSQSLPWWITNTANSKELAFWGIPGPSLDLWGWGTGLTQLQKQEEALWLSAFCCMSSRNISDSHWRTICRGANRDKESFCAILEIMNHYLFEKNTLKKCLSTKLKF